MKKLIIPILCMALVFVSCGDDDSDNGLSCSEATQNTATALSNFTNADESNFEALCNAYKLALQQQNTACGDPSGTIQIIIDGLGDCLDDVVIDDNSSNN